MINTIFIARWIVNWFGGIMLAWLAFWLLGLLFMIAHAAMPWWFMLLYFPLAWFLAHFTDGFLENYWPVEHLREARNIKKAIKQDVEWHLTVSDTETSLLGQKKAIERKPDVQWRGDELSISCRHHSTEQVDKVVTDALGRWNREVDQKEIVAGVHYYDVVSADFQLPKPISEVPLEPSFFTGTDKKGFAVYLNPAEPHVQVSGASGKGKSTLLRGMLKLLRMAWPQSLIVAVDMKGGVEYRSLADDLLDDHLDLGLAWLRDELPKLITERMEVLKSKNIRGWFDSGEPYIVLVVDEIADYLDALAREIMKTDEKIKFNAARDQAEGLFASVLRRGRAVGFKVIIATQRLDSNVLGGELKNNLANKICLGVTSSASALVATGGGDPELQAKLVNLPPLQAYVTAADGWRHVKVLLDDEFATVTGWKPAPVDELDEMRQVLADAGVKSTFKPLEELPLGEAAGLLNRLAAQGAGLNDLSEDQQEYVRQHFPAWPGKPVLVEDVWEAERRLKEAQNG